MREKPQKSLFVSLLVFAFLGAGCTNQTEVIQQSDSMGSTPLQQQEEALPKNDSMQEDVTMEQPQLESEQDANTDPSVTIDLETTEEANLTPPPVEADSTISSERELRLDIETPAEPELRVFTIEAKQWEFVPAVITVNQGDSVRLHVTSSDVRHGISLPTFGVSANLEPGETATVDFVADKKGTFSIVCSIFCGSGHGSMKGSLIVQ